MKILYSQIKELVPGLKASPKQVGEVLTMIGFMMDGFEEVKFHGKKDHLISLEIRQNRPDCLSVIGLAKEVAAYYGIPFKNPIIPKFNFGKNKITININTEKYVKRVVAVEISDIRNSESPNWLKSFLNFYGMNSINLLVDLSNYAMIMSGQPSHIFDKNKIRGSLSWSLNNRFDKIVTLDKSEVKIGSQSLIVEDEKNILALAGIVGGHEAKIELGTKSIIVEMAVYDGAIINKNSRSLNTITEASIRLGKKIDPNNLDFSMQYLISLILKYCGGKVESSLFNYYPNKQKPNIILFDPMLPSIYAGVEISLSKVEKILKDLGCKIKKVGKKISVTTPVNRTDLEIKEDLIEEVIRIFGYYNIAADKTPALDVVQKITPKIIYLSEMVRNILQANGFDEILSLPLVARDINFYTKYKNIKIVSTQNSINEEYPELRQSIAVGLILQLKNYLKLGIEDIKIFEIGKVFGKQNNKFFENESLGILIKSNKKNIFEVKNNVENVLRSLGVDDIKFYSSKEKPTVANPFSVFDVIVSKKSVGILYKLNIPKIENTYFAEINLEEICSLLEKINKQATFEITQKIITLDANVELQKEESIYDYLEEIKVRLGEKNVMAIEIADAFPLNIKIRYTIRVSYKNLSDPEAKKIHLKTFNLEGVH